MEPRSFPAIVVRQANDEQPKAQLETIGCDDLPHGEILVEVEYSSLNYKDALSATGHPGISPHLPHVPGIDAVGTVCESTHADLSVGDRVYLSGREFGSLKWGGWACYCRAQADWAFLIPEELTNREVIAYGTAGFTAAQCVRALLAQGIEPSAGPIAVTGSTGGVGCFSVAMLAKLGFEVAAVTGKTERHAWLTELGASMVVPREELDDHSGKPMLKRRWAGGIDTVGGNALTTLLRQTQYEGCVAACGLAMSPSLEMTVYPFILRAIKLIGIDSAWCSPTQREQTWAALAGQLSVPDLDRIVTEVKLSTILPHVDAMLQSSVAGRVVVNLKSA